MKTSLKWSWSTISLKAICYRDINITRPYRGPPIITPFLGNMAALATLQVCYSANHWHTLKCFLFCHFTENFLTKALKNFLSCSFKILSKELESFWSHFCEYAVELSVTKKCKWSGNPPFSCWSYVMDCRIWIWICFTHALFFINK